MTREKLRDYVEEQRSLDNIPYHVYSALIDGIDTLGQEPRKGHWKLVQRGKVIDVCCSNCEAVRIKGYAYNYTVDQLDKEDLEECFECADMRYCPNCGAKMKSEDV